MSTENVEVFNRYYGNGVATQFSVGFPYLSRKFVKVYLYKMETNEEVLLSSDRFSFVNDATIEYPVLPTDEILKEGDILTIQRETELGSEFEFDNQRRLFPVEVMNADDLAFQQIQELSREIKRSVRVTPTAVETPEELLGSVYEKLDSATSIAGEAIAAAGQATIAAEQATTAVEEAKKQVIATQEYIDEKRAEVDTIVAEAEASVDDAITQATEDVKQQALDAAQESIDTAAAQATEIVIDYANNELKPQLNEIASNASEDAANAAESAEIASNESEEAKHWAEDSRIWATGEDVEVEEIAPGEEEHSSRGYADLAMAIANTPEDVPVDMSKLLALDVIKGPKGEKGDKGEAGDDGKDGVDGKSVFDGYATNCITEIPQDIKLELKDGDLTLKAGSKVYIPNGFEADGTTPKFDVIVIENDMVFTTGASTKRVLFLASNGGHWNIAPEVCYSGNTAPSTIAQYSIWYDTANNIIRAATEAGSWSDLTMGLPLALATGNGESFSTIDQVFNGFGYIGSTVFALPGVKGLIPNGRNEDGSLRNIEFFYNTVKIFTNPHISVNTYIALSKNEIVGLAGKTVTSYDKIANKNVDLVTNTYVSWCTIGTVTTDASARIASFDDILPFRAVDYNDNSIDFVVESYNDGTNWYRVYKSGWIEQGGTANGSVDYWNNQLNFIKPMANNKYTITTSGYVVHQPVIKDKTTTGFKVQGQEATDRTYTSNFNGEWFVCGQGA